jgi:hypothetical protein
VDNHKLLRKRFLLGCKKAAKMMHLQVNQEKTKHMPLTNKGYMHSLPYTEIGHYKFETVHSFTYLGSKVNCKNEISAAIKKQIIPANRCFHGLRKHFKSQLIAGKQR